MATISDEQIANMLVAAKYDAENQMSRRHKSEAEDRVAILTELQSLRSQAGVSEAVACDEQLEAKIFNTLVHDYPAPYVKVKSLAKKLVPLYARPAPIEITEAAERAFKDGLAYGSNVRNADPDIAWGHSAIRAALQGET